MGTATEIMKSLRDVRALRTTAPKQLLGTEIKSETQIDMALETLPEMFSPFKVSYNMIKLNMPMTELMKELQNAKNVLKTKSGDAFPVTSIRPSSSKLKGNGGNKRKKSNKKAHNKSLRRLRKMASPRESALIMERRVTGREAL
ncbi:hypothetical protein DH2020_012679 [Rehmannia glutinosa]|uniref:Uncharacterized protein n=1 Tax=Rehmannia glutinosa TaxID=99300 RepID=A0ABR0X3L5_REHGL